MSTSFAGYEGLRTGAEGKGGTGLRKGSRSLTDDPLEPGSVADLHAFASDRHGPALLEAVEGSGKALSKTAHHVCQLLVRVPLDNALALRVEQQQQTGDPAGDIVEGHLLQRLPSLLESSGQDIYNPLRWQASRLWEVLS